MPRMLAISCAILLSGCTTWEQLDAGLSQLHGQHLSAAIARFGYPTSEHKIAGSRLLTWSSQNSGVTYLPQTSYGQASAYNPYTGFTTYQTTNTYMAPMPYNYQCQITLRVGDDDTILGSQYQGNLGGCTPYIQALERRPATSEVRVQMPPEFKR